jgi:hypothetical protein
MYRHFLDGTCRQDTIGLIDCWSIVIASGKAFPLQLDFLNTFRGHSNFVVPKTWRLVKYSTSFLRLVNWHEFTKAAYLEIFEGYRASLALYVTVPIRGF